jgi:hypothetical protein
MRPVIVFASFVCLSLSMIGRGLAQDSAPPPARDLAALPAAQPAGPAPLARK